MDLYHVTYRGCSHYYNDRERARAAYLMLVAERVEEVEIGDRNGKIDRTEAMTPDRVALGYSRADGVSFSCFDCGLTLTEHSVVGCYCADCDTCSSCGMGVVEHAADCAL
jgi:hypothetical protein